MNKNHHYVYISFSPNNAYIGVRSSKLPSNKDTYLGSGKFVKNNPDIEWKWVYGEYFSRKEAKQAERELLKFYNAADNPYFLNLTNDNSGCNYQNQEAREKISKANKGVQRPDMAGKNNIWFNSDRKGALNPMYGKAHCINTKKKISEARSSKIRYHFHHKEEGSFTVTQYELRKLFPELSCSGTSQIIRGKAPSYKGWRVLSVS